MGGSHEDFQKEESGAVLHGIFAQFPRLRTLEVPTALLFGFDAGEADLEDCSILPETLTELVLRIELDNVMGFYWGSRDINESVTSILHNLPDSFLALAGHTSDITVRTGRGKTGKCTKRARNLVLILTL